jgi:hypothetical protein
MIAKAAMLIRASPALEAAEREITARYTARLAGVLTAETGSADDDIEAWGRARLPGLPRVFRTVEFVLFHAASCSFRYSMRTWCGVR